MGKRIKIWLHAGASSGIREISIYKPLAICVVVLLFAVSVAVCFFGVDYYHLKKEYFDNLTLQTTVDRQVNEIKTQNLQVQNFAKEIEQLKSQVNRLSELENQVRLIADIRKPGDSSGLIGIGGTPENHLDLDIPTEKRHNALIREMHEQIGQTQIAAHQKSLDFEDLINKLEKKKNLLASTPSIRPVNGWITSRFGYRKSPFTGKKTFHSGLDIANRPGTKIVAPANGTITYAGRKMYFGNLVVIDHGYGKVTKFGHCEKLLVKAGQKVTRGTAIAELGNTGQSTGPHLHYEVRINGVAVNPLKYILN